MYAKVEEAKLGTYLLGMLSAVILMAAYAIIAVFVIYWTTLASVALANYVPDHTLAKGVATVCTALIGAITLPTFIEHWERKFIRWSWKNDLETTLSWLGVGGSLCPTFIQ